MKILIIVCLATVVLAANFKASLNRHKLNRKTPVLQKPISPKFGSAPVKTYMDTLYIFGLLERIAQSPNVSDGLKDPDFKLWQKHKYHDELSSTFASNNTLVANGFSAYTYFGTLEEDNVQIGNLTIEKQLFTSTYDIDKAYGYWPIDGIFGLGWKTLAVDYATPPFFNMIPQLDEPIFTIWLDPRVTTRQSVNGGQITFPKTTLLTNKSTLSDQSS
ncbi:Peptidase A1 domain-containing protein [Aphelenchoides bicaudatus]|nr:Peptidase A1 domain-containing protein [Aphelenchoides bicaudatus]